MGRIIVITSGKGGTGKTTSSINLGAAIKHFGEEVIIVDGNLTTPNVGLHLGAPIVPVSLGHVLTGKANVEDAIYEHETGVKIVPASLSINEIRKADHKELKNLSRKLRKIADYIIFDSSAGLGEEATSIIKLADEIIIVTNPDMPSIADALKTIKVAEQLSIPVRGAIITRARFDKTELTPENIIDMLETPVLGIIPEEFAVRESLAMKNPVVHTHPKSKASHKYKEIAANLLGIKYRIESEKRGFWKRVFGLE